MKIKPRHTKYEIDGYVYAQTRKPNIFILKVTRVTYYKVHTKYFQDKKEKLIEDWFGTNPPGAGHASRDSSVIYEYFDEVEELEREEGSINVLDI